MAIVINPNIPLVAAQDLAADIVLQPGSVISARVLQVLGNDTVRISIDGQSIDVLSQLPLQAGQTLQLAVSQSSDGSIRLALVNPQGSAPAIPVVPSILAGAAAPRDAPTLAADAIAAIVAQTASAVAAPKNALTPPEALAVSVAAQAAATRQTSLAPLFANLDVAAGLNGLPPQVQQAVAQLLTQRTSLDQGLTGHDIKQALQNSGLFLEATLASGAPLPAAGPPDLKAALIVLRQVLTTSLNGATATQNAPATQNALTAQSAPAIQNGAPAVTVPAPDTTAPATAAPPQGAAPTVAVPPAASALAAVAQQPVTPAIIVPGQGIPLSPEGSSQPVTIIEGAETATASPALAPLLASGIAASGVSLDGDAPQTLRTVINVGGAGQVIAPASSPVDAAARTAAGGAVLNLLQEALQAGPPALENPSGLAFAESQMISLLPVVTGIRTQPADDAEFARTNVPPPPIGGALPAAQAVAPATLVSNSPPETAMRHLLADTDAAIARQTLLQVASLPDRAETTAGRLDPTAPRWNFEIPFGIRQGTAIAQFEISRDVGGNEVEAAKRVWRARFSLDVEPAGPVHALVSLSGERTSVRMWAERPATAAQLRAGVAQLSQALSRAELQPGDIVVRDGAPRQTAAARAGHFLDRAL